MALELDIDLGVKAQGLKGDTGAQGPQGEAGKIYKPYIAEDGNMHAELINPDGTPVGGRTII